jgi:hypothetical protein
MISLRLLQLLIAVAVGMILYQCVRVYVWVDTKPKQYEEVSQTLL